MISQIYWLVPNHILFWKLSGEIPGSEIEEMSNFIAEQINPGTKEKIHIVIDAVGVRDIDYKSQIAQEAFQSLAKKPWMGNVITIIHNYQVQINLNVLSRAFGLKWHNVSTLDEANHALKRIDAMIKSISRPLPNDLIKRPVRQS